MEALGIPLNPRGPREPLTRVGPGDLRHDPPPTAARGIPSAALTCLQPAGGQAAEATVAVRARESGAQAARAMRGRCAGGARASRGRGWWRARALQVESNRIKSNQIESNPIEFRV